MTIVITSAFFHDNKLTFSRAKLVGVADKGTGVVDFALEPCDPLTVRLDQAEGPKFGPHPDGGWVSPPHDVLKEMEAAGVECDTVDHVRCRCHKDVNGGKDVISLEETGHTSRCPRRPAPALAAVAAPLMVPAPSPLGYSNPAGNRPDPAILNAIYADQAREQENRPATQNPSLRSNSKSNGIPPGGLDDKDLTDLMAALSGSNDPIGVAAQQVNISRHFDQVMVSRQLDRLGFGQCNGCKTWTEINGSRMCRSCGG